MQDCFLRRSDICSVVRPILKLARRFQSWDWPVLLIEMKGYGRTSCCIRDHLVGQTWTRKADCDGSAEIMRRIKRERWPLDIVLCGLYREYCVRNTANSLVESVPTTVITNASRLFSPLNRQKWGWNKKVRLIDSRSFLREVRLSA